MHSKGFWGETVRPPATSDNSIILRLDYIDNPKIQVLFHRSCLKQGKIIFSHEIILNFYNVYQINL